MNKIYLDISSLTKYMSNPLFNDGREGIISQYDDEHLIKIYHTHSITRENHFSKLEKQTRNIKLTTFPNTIILYNQLVIGCLLKYYRNYFGINKLSEYDHELIFTVLTKLIKKVRELTENNLYPIDLFYENILFNASGDVQIIDVDGDGILYSKDNSPLSCVLSCLNDTVLETLFKEYSKYGDYNVLFYYQVDEKIIRKMITRDLSYEFIEDFLHERSKVRIKN